MAKRKKLYEGKAKILYEGPQKDTLVQHFKDDTTAFNGEKHEIIEGKGVLNQRISEYIFLRLEDVGIATHFIKSLNMREQLIRKADIIPVEVVVRNVVAGSLAKRLGLKEGEALPRPLVEYFYKNDELGDPLVAPDHIVTFGWTQDSEGEEMTYLARRINDFLSGLFYGVGIRLIDFKLEFGRNNEGDLIVADEMSPDNCRLWDLNSNEKLDKDRFREGLGGVLDAYQTVATKLGLLTYNEGNGVVTPFPKKPTRKKGKK